MSTSENKRLLHVFAVLTNGPSCVGPVLISIESLKRWRLYLSSQQCVTSVYILKEDYLQIFESVSLWLHGCCGYWEGWALVNRFNHTSWVAVVTPTDRPKLVRNRYVIELFCAVVCVVTLPFWHVCWYRGFYHRSESYLFLFSLLWNAKLT